MSVKPTTHTIIREAAWLLELVPELRGHTTIRRHPVYPRGDRPARRDRGRRWCGTASLSDLMAWSRTSYAPAWVKQRIERI
jgi:hypothetical protein